VAALGNDLNNVVVMSGMTFAKQQSDKLSMLGRLRTLLGSAPQPPKSPRLTAVAWAGPTDAHRRSAKSEFGKRTKPR
jgi:hypothetical protein